MLLFDEEVVFEGVYVIRYLNKLARLQCRSIMIIIMLQTIPQLFLLQIILINKNIIRFINRIRQTAFKVDLVTEIIRQVILKVLQ